MQKDIITDPVTGKKYSRGSSSETYKPYTESLPSMEETGKTETPSTQNRVGGFANFTSALNQAVNLARRQRNDKTLDFLGGKIKPGSVSASSFSGILRDINTTSDQFSGNLVDQTLDFAKTQEEEAAKARSAIRDIALDVARNGGSQDIINAVLNTTDIDNAIAVAGSALSTKKGGNGKGSLASDYFTETQLATGAAAKGISISEFGNLPVDEANEWVYGKNSSLIGGRLPTDDFATLKKNMSDAVSEGKSREEIQQTLQSLNLRPKDELELLIYLDEVAPIKYSLYEGFKGLF